MKPWVGWLLLALVATDPAAADQDFHCGVIPVVAGAQAPAVAALASLHEDALVFFVSMIAGMYAYGTLHVIGSHDPDGGASALDRLLGKR